MMTCQCPDDKPLSCVAVATRCGMRGGRHGCRAALPFCYPGNRTEMLSWAAGSCLQPLCLHMSCAALLLLTVVSWAMPSPGMQNPWAWSELWCLGSHPSKILVWLDTAQMHLPIIYRTRPGPATAANALGIKAAPACKERRRCCVPNPTVTAQGAGTVVPALLRFRTAWEEGGMLRSRSSTLSTRQALGHARAGQRDQERDISSPSDRNAACLRCSALASQWRADLEPNHVAASSSLGLEQQPVAGAGSCKLLAAFKQPHQLAAGPAF